METPLKTGKCPLDRIDPSPFRAVGDLALREDALEALDRSLRAHGLWAPLPVRHSPSSPGRFELVFGHHRLAALRGILAAADEVDVEILDLTDAEMVRRMAAENGPEYAPDALTLMQQVRAAVEAFAAGRIVLPPVPRRTRRTGVRYAPSFLPADDRSTEADHPRDKAYTANTVAALLGYTTRDRAGRDVAKGFVKELLLALEAVERGRASEADFRGASLSAMRRIRLVALRKAPSAVGTSRQGAAPRSAVLSPKLGQAPEPAEHAPSSSPTPILSAPAPSPAPPTARSGEWLEFMGGVIARLETERPTWPRTEAETLRLSGGRVQAMQAIRDITAYLACLRPPPGPRDPDTFEWLLIELVEQSMDVLAVGRLGR